MGTAQSMKLPWIPGRYIPSPRAGKGQGRKLGDEVWPRLALGTQDVGERLRIEPGNEKQGLVRRSYTPAAQLNAGTREISGTPRGRAVSRYSQRDLQGPGHTDRHWSLWKWTFSLTNILECRPLWESQHPSPPPPPFHPSFWLFYNGNISFFSQKNHQPMPESRTDRPSSQFFLNVLPKLPRQIFWETALGWTGWVIHFIYHLNTLESWDRFIRVAAPQSDAVPSRHHCHPRLP